MKKLYVIALGGNALGNSPSEQLELVKKTAKSIVDLVESGADVVVSHGNGPQVGMINLGFSAGTKYENLPLMPFAECGAMSQGYIGYHLQQAISKELYDRKIKKDCATIITQVLVDKKDEAFNNPTKPIGSFYTFEEAQKLKEANGYVMMEDAQRGFRRVVASPIPKKIVEIKPIKKLLKQNTLVIACGGGGIPVILEKGTYRGVDAVIDKDRTSALLASELGADKLIILTTLDKVCINYKKEDEQELDVMNLEEAKKYIKQGEFAPGSMLPKVEAAMEFVKNTGNEALISSLEHAKEAISGTTGTIIRR